MRALVYTGPWSLEVRDHPDPEPGPGEVRLRTIATGICGSDLHGFTGDTGRRHPGQVMGHESVAVINALGAGTEGDGLAEGMVATFNPVMGCGDCEACAERQPQLCETRRVIGVDPDLSAAFAEYVVLPAANVVPLPAGIPHEYGALVEPLAVGYHAALRGDCRPSDRVLVIGAGPIGQACLLAARRLGADRIVVSEPNPQRRALAEELGAVAVDADADGLLEAQEALGGRATLILDAVGSSATIGAALRVSTRGGRIVLVGMNEPNISLGAYDISTQERQLIGSFCYSSDEFEATASWIATLGSLPGRLIGGRVDLAGAVDAFTSLARGELDASKVLVLLDGVAPQEAPA